MGNPIRDAMSMAARHHAGQTRKGPSPSAYTHHLAEVAALVSAFGGDTEMIAAAWLHDIVEDTDVSIEDLRHRYGDPIASMVEEVTDDPGLSKDRQKAAQIEHAPKLSSGAALIKAADQTSNMTGLVSSPPDWSDGRRAETLAPTVQDGVAGMRFVHACVRSSAADAAWVEL